MSQYGTGLARSTLGRTAKVPGQVFPARAPLGEQVAPLHGVMTGLANLVNEHLSRLTIGPQATRFLRHLERQTFGNAGLHRRARRSDPGLWCPYAHAAWAEALDVRPELQQFEPDRRTGRLLPAGLHAPGAAPAALLDGPRQRVGRFTRLRHLQPRDGAVRERIHDEGAARNRVDEDCRRACVLLLSGVLAKPQRRNLVGRGERPPELVHHVAGGAAMTPRCRFRPRRILPLSLGIPAMRATSRAPKG
jgi:hypothetical protein